MTANDNKSFEDEFKNPFGNDLEFAKIGEIFVHEGGTEWEVVGAYIQPTLMLRRVGAPVLDPLDREMLSVVPQSRWAEQWTKRDQPDVA